MMFLAVVCCFAYQTAFESFNKVSLGMIFSFPGRLEWKDGGQFLNFIVSLLHPNFSLLGFGFLYGSPLNYLYPWFSLFKTYCLLFRLLWRF